MTDRRRRKAGFTMARVASSLLVASFGCADGAFEVTGPVKDLPGETEGDERGDLPTGSIIVSAITNGGTLDLDADGYVVMLDGQEKFSIFANRTGTLHDLQPGDHEVELADIASNCSVQGDNPVTAAVSADETSTADFEVECAFLSRPIAFARNLSPDGNNGIFRMTTDGSHAVNLTGTDDWDDDPAWSPDGRRIAFARWHLGTDLWIMNADGSSSAALGLPGVVSDPSWSPDGTRIAFSAGFDGGESDDEIYVLAADGSNRLRLTNEPGYDGAPAWSPDGTRMAFATDRDGNREVYVMDADGSNLVNLTRHPGHDDSPVWAPDGTRIAFTTDRDGNREVYVMSADGSDPVNLTRHTGDDDSPAWAPEGSRIAFTTDRDGNQEIYVMDADGSNAVNLTRHPAADYEPAWSPSPES